MKIRNLFLILLMISAMVFAGCEKNEMQTEANSPNESNRTFVYNKGKYELYSKKLFDAVLNSLDDNDFKRFIKTEAIKQFDGDYDVLLATTLEQKIEISQKSCNLTFGEYLIPKLEESTQKVLHDEINYLDSILKYCPLIQISVPELEESSTEDWDYTSDEVLLAYLPTEFDEKTYDYITAYNKNGETVQLSLDTLPSVTVIVIGNNERVEILNQDNSKNSNLNLYYRGKYYDYTLSDSYQSYAETTENITTSEKGANSIDRDNYSGKDYLYKGKFESRQAFRQVESWPSGRPEFKVIIVYSDRNGSTLTANSVVKILSKDGWIKRYVFYTDIVTKTIDVPVFTWYKDRFGLYMKYHWIEQDNGDTSSEVSTTLSNEYSDSFTGSVTVKTTIKDGDDEAGEAIVEYEDPAHGEGTWYSTGIMTFSVTKK